jgi:hypothetical protein
MSLEQELADFARDPATRQAEWFRYYSDKRMAHQYMQVALLQGLDVSSVLEVGPYLGFASALLINAGFSVSTLDSGPALSRIAAVRHIQADLLTAPADLLQGHDAILCCEVLEHLEWNAVETVLSRFHEAKPKYLVISVPYSGFQVDLRLYLNAFTVRQSFSMKKFAGIRQFKKDPIPWGHKWEAGYRGYSLAKLEEKLVATGWAISHRDFDGRARSVFYLLCRQGRADIEVVGPSES